MISAEEIMLLAFAQGMPAAIKVIIGGKSDELNELYYELFDCEFDPCRNTETCDDMHDNDCNACPFDGFNGEELCIHLQEHVIAEMHIKASQKQAKDYQPLEIEPLLRLIKRKGIHVGIEAIVNADLRSLNNLYFALVRTNDSGDEGGNPCENDRICRYFNGCSSCPFDNDMENLCLDLIDRIITEIRVKVHRSQTA